MTPLSSERQRRSAAVPRWQRREFLRLALIQLGAWPLLSTLGCDGDSGKPDKDQPKPATDGGATPDHPITVSSAVHERVARLESATMIEAFFGAGELAHIEHIGSRYLAQFAPDNTDEQILAALEPTIRRLERHLSDDEAIAALHTAVTSEFEAVEVIDLDGWTLSPTEAALCALLFIADRSDIADAGTPASEDAG
jgi:hypothetical protein